MFGAWDSATRESYDGRLLQMRALDYLTEDFLSDNHALIVYHPNEGAAFVNVGFVGTITMVTGMNDSPMALSQIGVSNPDDTFGPQRNGHGTPFNFLLRDLMQFQSTLSGVENALTSATRTIDLILGFGVGRTNSLSKSHIGIDTAPFTGVQYV